jgi:hypothetical protein
MLRNSLQGSAYTAVQSAVGRQRLFWTQGVVRKQRQATWTKNALFALVTEGGRNFISRRWGAVVYEHTQPEIEFCSDARGMKGVTHRGSDLASGRLAA